MSKLNRCVWCEYHINYLSSYRAGSEEGYYNVKFLVPKHQYQKPTQDPCRRRANCLLKIFIKTLLEENLISIQDKSVLYCDNKKIIAFIRCSTSYKMLQTCYKWERGLLVISQLVSRCLLLGEVPDRRRPRGGQQHPRLVVATRRSLEVSEQSQQSTVLTKWGNNMTKSHKPSNYVAFLSGH